MEKKIETLCSQIVKITEKTSAPKGFAKQVNFTGFSFPIEVKDNVISRFEKMTPGIHINVFEYEDNNIYPLRINKNDLSTLLIFYLS